MRCASCGYLRDTHEPKTLKCHAATADKNGRRGKWREPGPVETLDYREIMARDAARRVQELRDATAPYVPEVVPPPQVPARPPAGPGEIAGYQGRQAVGLGRRAARAGWAVAAYYSRRHDGEEMSAVKIQSPDGELFAVATWTRKPGHAGELSGWSADIAYGVQRGAPAVKLGHTQLEEILAHLLGDVLGS